jgi:hypothetical protein
MSKLSNGKILKGDVGTGKSRVALAYFADHEPGQHLYVITTARKRDSGDWEAEAKLFGIYCKVDSWNNLERYVGVENAFFIFDEQRVVGSGVWVKAFLEITKKNEWILLSATPGDTWMDYIPVFLANGFYPNRSSFIREHVIFSAWTKYPKVERILGEQQLERLLASIIVEMPYKKHTTRHSIDRFVDYDRERYETAFKRRWHYLEDRPIRHVSEMFSLMRRATNDHPDRLQAIKDLMVLRPRLIVFYNFDYELEALRTLEVTKAEWNGHKHEPVPDADEWVYIVQYAAASEAWNCTLTDTMVFYSLTYSYKVFEQSKGRIDRLDTPFGDLYYFVLRSPSPLDAAILRSLDEKRSFNEMDFLRTEV